MGKRKELKDKFNAAMFSIYEKAKYECDYNATRFLQMLNEHGGFETANLLLHSPNISDGLVKLWECHRLDLTVEALIVEHNWGDLFSDEKINIAKKRLDDFGYKPKKTIRRFNT